MKSQQIVRFDRYDGVKGYLGEERYDAHMVVGKGTNETVYLVSENQERIFRVLNDAPNKTNVAAKEIISCRVRESILLRIFGEVLKGTDKGL